MFGEVTYWVTGGLGSEFFRAEHGDDEVDERGEGDEADEDVFHGGEGVRVSGKVRWRRRSPDLFTEIDVGGGEGEEGHGQADEEEVAHVRSIADGGRGP
jgi:hypothetical protein